MVEILSQEGDWYQIEHGDGSAYVAAEYVQTGEATAVTVEEYKEQQATEAAVNVGNGELDLWLQLFSVKQEERAIQEKWR